MRARKKEINKNQYKDWDEIIGGQTERAVSTGFLMFQLESLSEYQGIGEPAHSPVWVKS